MEITINRYARNEDYTLGSLSINGVFLCYTLEDTYREGEKIKGKTAIPNGTYKIKFRNVGRFNQRYKRRFASIYKGMLELQNVPNFKYVLIHCGNNPEDTEGCLLLGNASFYDGTIAQSELAFRRVYPIIADALEKGEEVNITYSI